ncbi:hypothetical protein ACVLVH_001142 [Kluyvera sp. 1366]|jgi:hypothetical protein
MFDTVKMTSSHARPVFTYAIRKADSVVTHSDQRGVHIYHQGPSVRTMTLGLIMELSIGSDLACWSIVDYQTAGPHTVLYQVSYSLLDNPAAHDITIELNSKEEGAL